MDNLFLTYCGFLAGEETPQESYSEKAQRLYDVLSQVSTETIFGQYIRGAIDGGKFHQLVKELKEDLIQAPVSLRNTIGTEAVELLKQL